jgi:hypothetical protein
MPQNLTKLILKAAEDPRELSRLTANFDAVSAEYELSEAEKALILSRNSISIRNALYEDLVAEAGDTEWVIVLINVETGHHTAMEVASERFAALIRRYR